MKKFKQILIILSVIFLFENCASQQFQHIDKEKIISSLDFTKYQKNDFLITPGEYGADYTTIGIFTFTIYAEANYIIVEEIDSEGEKYNFGKWISNDISAKDILDLAYQTALKKGANAMTHFKLKNISKTIYDGKNEFIVNGLEMSGLLIKREN